MKIALLTNSYPPASNEGIPRQRQVLAETLVEQGHDVHVCSIAPTESHTQENGVHVHRVATARTGHHLQVEDGVALYLALLRILRTTELDIVDAPIWAAPGWPTLAKKLLPVVINLQTTSYQLALMHESQCQTTRHLIEMERYCIRLASGILADSKVALETTRADYGIPDTTPTACIYHGIPDCASTVACHQNHDGVEALAVGRLEIRKGTEALFRVLPNVLNRCKNLRIRFIGGDNSDNDGWKSKTGFNYSQWFRHHYPELEHRVFFDGYVPEPVLIQRRRQADLILAPSLYESFGFVYIEAMREARPVVAIDNNAANEIFPRGEEDGALIVPRENDHALADAIMRLATDANLREKVGKAGRKRFLSKFQASRMAAESAAFYQQVLNDQNPRTRQGINQGTSPPFAPRKMYQVMEALEEGDGVSQIAMQSAELLQELGQPSTILNRWKQPAVKTRTAPYQRILEDPFNSLIVHYWNYSRSLWLMEHAEGPHALYFHNITPPDFFLPGSAAEQNAAAGWKQLQQYANRFDIFLGDSWYNLKCIAPYVDDQKPMLAIYPVFDVEPFSQISHDQQLLKALTYQNPVNWLFVGRIARNKRQDDLMLLFNTFAQSTEHIVHLWLVGNDQQDPVYREELERLRLTLSHGHRIHFTGKVPEAQLMAYYRAATLFVCASEHEGFCMPIAQAMAMNIPVVARAAAAVPETMGHAGVCIQRWIFPEMLDILQGATFDETMRQHLLTAQHQNLARFSRKEARNRLLATSNFLLHGKTDNVFISASELREKSILTRSQ